MKNKSLTYFLTGSLLAASSSLLAQAEAAAEAAAAPAAGTPMTWALNNLVLILGGAIIVGAFLALYNATSMLLQAQKIRILQEHGVEVLEKIAPQFDEPWWKRMYDKWTNAVPIEREQDIVLEHPHDGIYELDNSLPPWWVALFYITIAFSVVYVGYYHVFAIGAPQAEQYKMEMEEADKAVKAYLAQQTDLVDETNVTALDAADQLAIGGAIFKEKCAVCHGQLGEGGVGPNMTDEYWIHGGGIQDIFKTIKYGVPAKGMISWKEQLKPAEMQRVASYILTLQGTNPPNPKEPEGERFATADAAATAPADSTAAAATTTN
jgi:cytochrome c oxidase cbb3-type subunit 3